MIDKQVPFNLYDYFAFPNREKRDESKIYFDVATIKLLDADQCVAIFDELSEKYNTWSCTINNFSSSLWLHFLLMYQHYSNCDLDFLTDANSKSSSAASKILFDAFAEDTSLYSISYFDKLLKMFEDLFDVNPIEKRQKGFRRDDVIKSMEKRVELAVIAKKFKEVTLSPSFKAVKTLRDNFVHNKSSSYIGLDTISTKGGISYTYSCKGLSTKKVFNDMTSLLSIYGDLCKHTNEFLRQTLI